MDRYRDKKAEAESVREGLTNIVTRYAVALVPETGSTIGSGVLVSHEGNLYVATAQHLAEHDGKAEPLDFYDVQCIPKPSTPVHMFDHPDERRRLVIRPDLAPARAFRLPVSEVRSSKANDVALLHLSTRPDEFASMEFYPLDRARSTELPHDKAMVCGFPFELTLVHRPTGHGTVFSRTVWGTLGTIDHERFDPNRQLLITYEDDGKGVMDAHGMSGGAVWSPSVPGSGIWNPDDQILIGIQSGVFETIPGRPLVAVRIEEVKRLLT